MKTKEKIKETGRELFNKKGLKNVTLRDIAKELGKSYGNITYHFRTKEILLLEIYQDMNEELMQLRKPIEEDEELLEYILNLPGYSFELTLKYLFFTMDFNEIKRTFPSVFSKMKLLNNYRKGSWFELLLQLYNGKYLREDLEESDLNYLMFLSGSVRSAYFQYFESSEINKKDYIDYVNLLLKPYLSPKGLKVYMRFSAN